jgi:hypothetical protein
MKVSQQQPGEIIVGFTFVVIVRFLLKDALLRS